ncbi:replication-relaxation family protein [Paenibacillus alginolyticus]|uniref:replication-relaxation family protein n=1 Tax=Paenibacillus alginolyticus TaxID=59839 RepID=UPI0003F518D3|nr:replication-relaxation family protein [Paenibacillus alginolyticus]MCY9668712.1 replication-relaxation family protein [Paenibacillus alginolyticus]
MYYTAKKEMMMALYRYTLLTAEQGAALLNYRIKTVYSMVAQLRAEGVIRSILLPFLRNHHVGYCLSAKGARAAASLCGDEETFRAKAWEDDPVQLEHYYGTNRFFTDLIHHSLPISGDGFMEWLDPREAADRYVQVNASGRKTRPVKPDGFGSYLRSGRGRLVFHLEYDTGTENLWRLKDKLFNYGRLLPAIWPQVEAVHVLFVTKIASRPKALLDIWEVLQKETFSGDHLPNVWAIHETEWKERGVDRALWWGSEERRLCLMDLPLLPLPPDTTAPILGKQLRESSPMYRR